MGPSSCVSLCMITGHILITMMSNFAQPDTTRHCKHGYGNAVLVCLFYGYWCICSSVENHLRFDIYSFGFDTAEDDKGMLKTVSSLNALISAELSSTDIDASRIVLGGFSQGGAMSLLTGLTNERKFGGIAVLSGWLPLRGTFKAVRRKFLLV